MSHDLDPFQQVLLDDLRAVVRSRQLRPVRDASPAGAPASRPARRTALVAAAASMLLILLVVGTWVARPTPAFAVDLRDGGVVDVEVGRLEDAAGLESALAAAGVRADVLYLPASTECAEGRYVEGQAPDPGAYFAFSLGSDGYTVHLEPGAIGPDQTLVISAARIPDGVTGSIGVAEGAVAPCEPIPASW